MQVEVRLFATLRRYLPSLKAGEGYTLNLPEGATVADALAALGVPVDDSQQAFVDGQAVGWDHVLKEGDSVRVFPPMAGGGTNAV